MQFSDTIGVDSNAKLISRSTLARRINDRFDFMKTSLTAKLEPIKYLCITVDAWTCDGNRRSYLGMKIHWVLYDFSIYSIL